MKGLIFTEAAYIENQIAFYKSNAVKEPDLLGMEFEHFLVDRSTLRSYDYHEKNGQRDLLEALIKRGWRSFSAEEGNVFGIEKEGHTLTLEPGGQVEISLKPFSGVCEIDQAYETVLSEIGEVLLANQCLVSLGYHPKTKIDELSLLPKKRYGLMYEYFEDKGNYCHNMMKGTAATQVSIDYSDEADFIKKFRVANFLSPAIASLYDATPIFEGELDSAGNRRLKIWNETDVKRSKLIKGCLTERFGFKDYAAYLLSLPPILIASGGGIIETQESLLKDLLPLYAFDSKDLEHLQSMVFPDIRLKRFLEIRMPDAMPYPYNISLAALVKGIFYNAENLNAFYERSLLVGDDWVNTQNQALIHAVANAVTPELVDLKNWMVDKALSVLSIQEGESLQKLKDLGEKEGSMAAYLRRLAATDTAEFLDVATVVRGLLSDVS